ncbi:MAG: Prokaryotic lipoprotein-attachment site [Cellvibrio sp.]|jgi:predicted small lipoprotein YifL|nr:Prokaryotic lipoprotein-attachment site [Cellvibrio sp.]
MKIAVVLISLCLSLGACGQKGPLYLPQPAKPQPEAPAPQAETPAPQAGSEQTKVDQSEANQPANPVD